MNKKTWFCVFIIIGVSLFEVLNLYSIEILRLRTEENKIALLILNRRLEDLERELCFRKKIIRLYLDFLTDVEFKGMDNEFRNSYTY